MVGAAGAAGGVVVGGSKVYAGAARPAPPRAQFYGHNPNLKLPPDLFLLGCVFHIVSCLLAFVRCYARVLYFIVDFRIIIR